MGFTPESKRLILEFRNRVRTLEQALLRGGRRVAVEVRRQVIDDISGDVLKVRSGSLRRSVESYVQMVSNALHIVVGSVKGPSSPYAAALNYGNPKITPKKGKWLAIPQKPALTPAGVARYKSARQAPVRLFFVKPKGREDTAFLFEVPPKAGSNRGALGAMFKEDAGARDWKRKKLWYVLKKQVSLPAYKWLSNAVERATHFAPQWIEEEIIKHLTGKRGK